MQIKTLKASTKLGQAAMIGVRVWRTLGAAVHAEAFADIIKLGAKEEKIVRAFSRAYDQCVFGGASGSLRAFERYRDALIALIEAQLPPASAEIAIRAVYARDIAVQYRRLGAVKLVLDAMKQSAERAAKIAIATMKQAEQLQALASGLVHLMGTRKAFARAYKLFSQVISPQNSVLRDVFKYILDHKDAIRAAWKTRKTNPQAYEGLLSKIKSLLHEAYTALSPAWLAEVGKVMKEATRAAVRLGPGWKVERITGGMRFFGLEIWDEAILLVRRAADGSEEAVLFMAAQFKAEKKLSALKQVLRDGRREADALLPYADEFSFMPNVLTVTQNGKSRVLRIIPNPGGRPPLRYIVNTDGAAISAAQDAMLKSAGIQVQQMEQSISAEGMTAIADAFVHAVMKVLP